MSMRTHNKMIHRILASVFLLVYTSSTLVHSFVGALTSPEPIRLNKVFKQTHSRRQADQLIASGRITVNGEPVHSAGQRVIPFQDIVMLDGKVVTGWEKLNHISTSVNGKENTKTTMSFEYIKYWKPLGVTCTTDQRVKDNLIEAVSQISLHLLWCFLFFLG